MRRSHGSPSLYILSLNLVIVSKARDDSSESPASTLDNRRQGGTVIAEQIRAHVETTLAESGARRHIYQRIDEFAGGGGTTLGPDDRENLSAFCEGYIRNVVDLLIVCDAAATRTGASQFASPILQIAAGYFLNPHDYIPDGMGVLGLLDDAYLACRFVSRVSEIFAAERGFALLDTSLDRHSPTVRVLIGEPLATRLDTDIEHTIAHVAEQLRFAQIQQWIVQPSWNAWAQRENVVNTEAQIMSIASGNF
jgi:uncharacterized membrane protein YkvA (DUF1232 family)